MRPLAQQSRLSSRQGHRLEPLSRARHRAAIPGGEQLVERVVLEVRGQQSGKAIRGQMDLLQEQWLTVRHPDPLEVERRRTQVQLQSLGDALAGRLGTRLDDPRRRVEPAPLHLLGEAHRATQVDFDGRPRGKRPAPPRALETMLARQLGQRSSDRDQAAAIADREIAFRRQPVTRSPLATIEGRTQIEVDLMVERDRAGLEEQIAPSLADASCRGIVTPVDVAHAVADNVISNHGLASPSRESHAFGARHAVGLKSAVVGGGSTYTPELIEGLAARHVGLPIDQIVLLDPDLDRLAVVAGLSRRIVARTGAPIRVIETDDRSRCARGRRLRRSSSSVSAGRRRVCWTRPCLPGSAASARRRRGLAGSPRRCERCRCVLDLAEEAGRRAPRAWIVDFTNPVGIVTQALLDAGHRAIGLCNVAIGFQRRLAAHWGVAPERVELDHVGLNHLTWLRAARLDGVDRLPALIEGDLGAIIDDAELPHALVRALGAIPSYYLRYYYMTGDVLAEQAAVTRERGDVIDIERELLELYRDPTLDRKPALLEQRGGAFYSEAAAQLIASLHAGTGDVQVVDTRNLGAIEGLPDDSVVEVPARIDRSGASPLSTGATGARDARAGPGRQGLRDLDHRGGHDRRPRDRASCAAGQSPGAGLSDRRRLARGAAGQRQRPSAEVRATS